MAVNRSEHLLTADVLDAVDSTDRNHFESLTVSPPTSHNLTRIGPWVIVLFPKNHDSVWERAVAYPAPDRAEHLQYQHLFVSSNLLFLRWYSFAKSQQERSLPRVSSCIAPSRLSQ